MVNCEEDFEIIQAESTRLPIYIASIREETFDTIRHENIFQISEETMETIAGESMDQ